MNTGSECDRLRREFEHDLFECLDWIRNANLRGSNGVAKTRRNEDCRRARFAQERSVSWVRIKGNLPRHGFAEGRRACDFHGRIAHQLPTRHHRYFLKSKGHSKSCGVR